MIIVVDNSYIGPMALEKCQSNSLCVIRYLGFSNRPVQKPTPLLTLKNNLVGARSALGSFDWSSDCLDSDSSNMFSTTVCIIN